MVLVVPFRPSTCIPCVISLPSLCMVTFTHLISFSIPGPLFPIRVPGCPSAVVSARLYSWFPACVPGPLVLTMAMIGVGSALVDLWFVAGRKSASGR